MNTTYEHVLIYRQRAEAVKGLLALAAVLTVALHSTAVSARDGPRCQRVCHRSHNAGQAVLRRRPLATTPGAEQPNDRLYRQKGYGIGGAPVVLGAQGGLGLLGTCAGLRNPAPPCGTSPFGIYGNGLVYGFGHP